LLFSTFRLLLEEEQQLLELSEHDDECHSRLAKFALRLNNKDRRKPSVPIMVCNLILDVMPTNDSEVGLEKLEEGIRKIKKYGLHWGLFKHIVDEKGRNILRLSFIAEETRSYGVGTVIECIQDCADVKAVSVRSFKEEVDVY